MTADLSADLDRIEGLAAAATDGPWVCEHGRIWRESAAPGAEEVAVLRGSGWAVNAALITAARTDLPKPAAVARAVLGVVPRVAPDWVCQHGGHIPNRDRALPGSCDFHRRMATEYVAALGIEVTD